MKTKIFLTVALLLLIVGCSAEPETIVETRIVEQMVEVPVTIEVTRLVEVAVETTREVEVTREVPLEVTRIVEVVVTATPEPTPEPTATHTPAPVVESSPAEAAAPAPTPAGSVTEKLLAASRTLHDAINSFRAGLEAGDCFEIVRNQDIFLASPAFDVSGAPSATQSAYGQYLAGLEIAKDAALGIGQGCRDAIATNTGFTITYLNYNDINGKLARALNELNPAIAVLESISGG